MGSRVGIGCGLWVVAPKSWEVERETLSLSLSLTYLKN
jgi:hypothetical protein